jgi:hypothetical protein
MLLREFNFCPLASTLFTIPRQFFAFIEMLSGSFSWLIVSDCIELGVEGTVFAMVIFCQTNIGKDFQACQQPRKLQIQPLS